MAIRPHAGRADDGDDALRRRGRPAGGPRRAAGRRRVEVSQKEVDMARQLIESLSTDFEPDKYSDEYRDRCST